MEGLKRWDSNESILVFGNQAQFIRYSSEQEEEKEEKKIDSNNNNSKSFVHIVIVRIFMY